MPGGLVGREQEFLRVGPLFSGLAAGRGGLLLVTGQPGIGKTRATEFVRRGPRRRIIAHAQQAASS